MSGHAPRADTPSAALRLALGALGVVYGDIGTSPLYAIKECFAEPHGVRVTPENVLGILSLMFWAFGAELYTGPWTDVGTPERLDELNR